MITIEQYNWQDSEAVSRDPALHRDNVWGVASETIGHIVTVQKLQDLQPLLNRFQCDRFRTYLYELGGLSALDLDQFLLGRYTMISMQRAHWPGVPIQVPVETMLSALSVYRKIKTARPMVATVLEIGPGAGLNSLFLAGDPAIRNYTQIEATQALYLLQAMVNDLCYEQKVWEAALPLQRVAPPDARVWHIPWWRLDDLYNTSIYYDVITANACLNEISDQMVWRYLRLFNAKSHNDTLLLVQDVGAWTYRDQDTIENMLRDAGWHIAARTEGTDIEAALREQNWKLHCGRGDAVSTWWLTKRTLKPVLKLDRRCAAGLCMLEDDCQGFKITGADQRWTRADLEYGPMG